MNIIIRTPNFIGDTIMMLPALGLLKMEYPDASYTIVCKAHSRDLFRGKGIDKIIIDDTKGKNRVSQTSKLIKEIKKSHFDLGVLFHNTFMDAVVFKLSNIDTIIGYEKENRKVILDFWLKIDRSRHYINHYANLVNQYLDNKYETIPPMHLHTQEQQLVLKDDKPLIGFMLGTDKRDRGYPKDLSIELFNLIKDKNFHIVLLGDANDSKTNNLYEKELSSVTNLSGKTTVAQYIDVINSLDMLVTIDTSSMHIAAATGTKFITLLGMSSSPFCIVKPKVDFGSYMFFAKNCLIEKNFIKEIKPTYILDEINKRLDIAN